MARVSSITTLKKKADETLHFDMDFTNRMATGETIEDSSPAPAATQTRQGGTASTDLTIGSLAVSGQTVTMTISGGTDGRKYKVNILITTSTGQILSGDGILSIRD